MTIRKKNKKKKYIAIFVLKEQGTFTRLGKKKFKPTDNYVRFNKRTFILDTSFATYSRGLKQFFFIDLINGQTYLEQDNQDVADAKLTKKQKREKEKEDAKLLKLQNKTIDPEITDMLISRKVIAQLTTNLNSNAIGINIMTLIVGVVMGGFIGYTIAGM